MFLKCCVRYRVQLYITVPASVLSRVLWSAGLQYKGKQVPFAGDLDAVSQLVVQGLVVPGYRLRHKMDYVIGGTMV